MDFKLLLLLFISINYSLDRRGIHQIAPNKQAWNSEMSMWCFVPCITCCCVLEEEKFAGRVTKSQSLILCRHWYLLWIEKKKDSINWRIQPYPREKVQVIGNVYWYKCVHILYYTKTTQAHNDRKRPGLGKKVNSVTALFSVVCLCSFRLQRSFDYTYKLITTI